MVVDKKETCQYDDADQKPAFLTEKRIESGQGRGKLRKVGEKHTVKCHQFTRWNWEGNAKSVLGGTRYGKAHFIHQSDCLE